MPTKIPQYTLDKFNTFGDLLRFLRRRVGLTQLDLASAVGYSDTQISRLEQNLRLPDIPTIEARFISALYLEDDPAVAARLVDLAANARREDSPGPGLCPYKGLQYFDEADADLFVGREMLSARLLDQINSLAGQEEHGAPRFLAVVGASGSGKSSLVRAGLVSAVRWDKNTKDWEVHVLTPTAHPLESLAAGLTASVAETAELMDDLARDNRSLQIFINRRYGTVSQTRFLLIVDQFEELFALCRSENERKTFIDNLMTAASVTDGPVIVLITIRADFYVHCADYPALREALARNQVYIGAMNEDELRRAIEEPARRGRWELEAGLVELLMHDSGHEPGALPLLSHALFETWQRRRGRLLTFSGYASSGGVRGAIAETAETVFSDQFTLEQKTIARRIFLRLTELGDDVGMVDTRRRATFDELILHPDEAVMTRVVLKALADARLITTTENGAEVAHEALIREWPTLQGWLEENRDGLHLHRQLTAAALEWQETGREPDMLYRGARLSQANEWASSHKGELNEFERAFLQESNTVSEQQALEREAQRRRELEAAWRLAESEKQRAEIEHRRAEEQLLNAGRLRKRSFYLVGALGLMVIAAFMALVFSNRNAALAVQNAWIAETAQAASTQAIAGFTHAEAQRLAAEANALMINEGDANLIALLAIHSLALQYTPTGHAVLSGLTDLEVPPRVFSGHTGFIFDMDISPDGKFLATGSTDGTARIWDLSTGETVQILSAHTDAIDGIAFSPDGKSLATGSFDKTVRVWDAATGATLWVLAGHTAEVGDVRFSPDGKYLVSVSGDHTARVWDLDLGETVLILTGHSSYLTRAAYSPDGRYILTGSGDDTARLWDARTGETVRVFSGHTNDVSAVAFTPDGRFAATGDDHTVRLWSVDTGSVEMEFVGHKPGTWLSGIAFSKDGALMASVSGDETARLWDAATGKFLRFLGVRQGVLQDVVFSPDSKLVVTAGDSGVANVWNLQTFPGGTLFSSHTGAVWQASFSPDGMQIVTASEDNTARIWDVATGRVVAVLAGHTVGLGGASGVRGAEFSPDGRTVLTAGVDGTARIWSVSTGQEIIRFEGHTDMVNRAAFSPDGKYVVTASFDGTARVWNVDSAQPITIFMSQGPRHVNRAVFSPDGKLVATSGDDGTARVWDPLTAVEFMTFIGHTDIVTGIAFSRDGRTLATASDDGTIRLWEVATGVEIQQFTGHPGRAFGISFSPNGRYLLTSGDDGTARLWDLVSGVEVRRFTGHTDQVRDTAFSPEGATVLTASHDNTARLWLTDLADTIRAFCALLIRDLTPAERIQFGIPAGEQICPAQ